MELKNEAIKLKKFGLKIEEISEKLGISSKTVWRYTRGVPHPKNIHVRKPLPDFAKILSVELSQILGYLAAEGCDYDRIDNHIGFDKRRNKAYKRHIKRTIIEFSNTNQIIQDNFRGLIDKVFGYSPKFSKKGTLRINRVEVVKHLRGYSRFGSKMWSVPKEILDSKDKILKSAFCRAFADGDGTVDIIKKEIRLDSTNKKGLKQIQILLKDLGICSKFYTFESRARITIKDIRSFYNKIGFLHPEKQKRLKKLLGSN